MPPQDRGAGREQGEFGCPDHLLVEVTNNYPLISLIRDFKLQGFHMDVPLAGHEACVRSLGTYPTPLAGKPKNPRAPEP